MAKKSGRKRLSTKRINLDNTLTYLYHIGIFHSIIFHTILFLILALTVLDSHQNKHIRISLSFNTVEMQSLDTDNPEALLEDTFIAKNESSSEQQDAEKRHLEEATTNILLSDAPHNLPIDEQYTSFLIEDSITSIELPSDEQLSQIIEQNEPHTSTQRRASRANQNQQNPDDIIRELRGNLPASNRLGDGDTVIGIGDIQKRLSKAGAKSGDVQISIAWNTTDDIDLHVLVRSNGQVSLISWNNRIGINGGMLDVDMNASFTQLVHNPVENVFWAKDFAPHGEYVIGVHHFRSWSMSKEVPVTVVIKTNDKINTYNVIVSRMRPMVEVTRFNR